jgi:hypothetical protein
MVCCEAFWNLEMWQRVDSFTDHGASGQNWRRFSD